jgi:hypothetical protein
MAKRRWIKHDPGWIIIVEETLSLQGIEEAVPGQ